MNLYADNKEAWDAIAVYRPAIAEMAKHFDSPSLMEDALCYGPSVIIKWVRKRGGVSLEAERRAQKWLDTRHAPRKAIEPAPDVAHGGTMLIVACPDHMVSKAIKLLAVLGCEATEV